MNEKEKLILFEILRGGGIIKQEKLQHKLKMSERQVDYQLQSINFLLEKNNLPTIIKKNGNFITSLSIKQYLMIRGNQDIILSAKQRQNYIMMTILTRKTALFLNNFIYELRVSRNTVITDIKKLRKDLEKNGTTLKFNRSEGYTIKGSEWNKRNLLRKGLISFYKELGYDITKNILKNIDDYIDYSENIIKKLEKEVNIIYTDEDYNFLNLFLACIFIRCEQDKLLESEICIESFKEVTDTLEYLNLSKLITNISKEDIIYISLQFLCTNMKKSNINGLELNYKITNALWQFLLNFETNSFLTLSDKKTLIEQLVNHFRPAYFRIKYDISLVDSVVLDSINKYVFLQEMVKSSVDPLQELLKKDLPSDELAYITLFIGGHLVDKEQKNKNKIIKAVTVCPNGISSSKILERELKKIFPEFFFYPAYSVRDYDNFALPHDVVFTNVAITSKERVYLVNKFMSDSEKLILRRKVLSEIFNVNFNTNDISKIIEVVEKYTEIKNLHKLKSELNRLLLTTGEDEISSKGIVEEILQKTKIQILKGDAPWKYIVESVTEPLVDETIECIGIRKLWKMYKNCPEYVFLNERIVLLHIDPKEVVQKLGMSILISQNGIDYGESKAHVIALLTTPNKWSHLDVLYFLSRLSRSKELIKKLVSLDKVDNVRQMLIDFSRKKV